MSEDATNPTPSAPTPDDAPHPADAGAPSPAEQPAAREAEVRGLTDQLQRLAADFSNYQKRMERRVQDERDDAVRRVVLDLLPALDDLERALEAAREAHDFDTLMAGLRLVRERFLAGLKAHGITPIDAERCAFDPEHHEAVAHVPSDEHPAGHIIGEAQRGYRHGVQTLRASRVAVSSGEPGGQKEKAPPDETGEPEADAGEAEGDTDADV